MRKQGLDFFAETKESGCFDFSITLADGRPADLTGWTAKFLMKNKKSDEDTTAFFTKEKGFTDSSDNHFIIDFDSSLTDRDIGKYYYVLFLIKEDKLLYLQQGNFYISLGGSK